ncbi:AraC family transcriptional regulator [Alcanivorax sp. S6407]|uniref:AraC family transcriptional regulator n=1 Tax=Alcanivorax sp. S6407 TaxID=2926424 RepID=UPI001FF287A7|nr:AraC family transcriptional regulator [Alcanivorax sp. S6407]MCK0152868.1 AraC family transcriptional regulator [Alcanivorax sp. S6407]
MPVSLSPPQAAPRRRIPASFVLALYEYLDQQGVDSEGLLPLPRPRADSPLNADIPIGDWRELLDCAATHLQDPLLGLHLGQTLGPRHIGVLGYVVMASQNLGEALNRLHRYQRLIYDVTPLEVRSSGISIELVWDADHGRPGPLVDETAITVLVHICRRLSGVNLSPLQVSFINPWPDDTSEYERYFGCPVQFDQPETIISMDMGLLLQPLDTADPAMLAMLEEQADALLAQLPSASPLVDEVRRRISRLLPEHNPDIATVSKNMGVSVRTLQRQLSEAGTSFLKELGAVRREIAERYLRETRLGLVDIALLVGYSEHSAFTRSFIRWTGMTPLEYRNQNS